MLKLTIQRKIKPLFKTINRCPYIGVNLGIAGIIIVILLYSGIFSTNGFPHPIKSQTTEQTVSTGLSRAFSEIIRLNIESATTINPFALSIFLFFIVQLFLRLFFSLLLLKFIFLKNLIVFTDVLSALLLFLWAFYDFIVAQF